MSAERKEHDFERIMLDLAKPVDQRLIKQREGPRPKGGGAPKKLDYIEWETVCDILNAKAPGWRFEIKNLIPTNQSEFVCHGALTIEGVTRENVGTGDAQFTLDAGVKGAVSDCLKRCAVLFGVGLQLYRDERAQSWAEARIEREEQAYTEKTRLAAVPAVEAINPGPSPKGPRVDKKTVIAILSAAATASPRLDAQVLSFEFYGKPVEEISAEEGEDLLNYCRTYKEGEPMPPKRKPLTLETARERLAAHKPEYGAAFDAQAPREPIPGDVLGLEEVEADLSALDDAVARDDAREEKKPTLPPRDELIETLRSLRADEFSYLDERRMGDTQPKLSAKQVSTFSDLRLAELVEETRERIRRMTN